MEFKTKGVRLPALGKIKTLENQGINYSWSG